MDPRIIREAHHLNLRRENPELLDKVDLEVEQLIGYIDEDLDTQRALQANIGIGYGVLAGNEHLSTLFDVASPREVAMWAIILAYQFGIGVDPGDIVRQKIPLCAESYAKLRVEEGIELGDAFIFVSGDMFKRFSKLFPKQASKVFKDKVRATAALISKDYSNRYPWVMEAMSQYKSAKSLLES